MTMSAAERILRASLREATAALRRREVTSVDLVGAAIEHHHALGDALHAYRSFDEEAEGPHSTGKTLASAVPGRPHAR